MFREADFSPCKTWRYSLRRRWLGGDRKLVMVMLNPSIADETRDDPTTTAMVRRAERGGFGRYEAVNLFAMVATDPQGIYEAADPVGPGNDAAILRAIEGADRIIVAWGNHGSFRGRDAEVLALLAGRELSCFGRTILDAPRFPRAIKSDAPLVRFNG